MGQDIRELLQNDKFRSQSSSAINKGHELRFLDKLDAAFPEATVPNNDVVSLKKNNKWYMSIAASVVVTLGLGTYVLTGLKTNTKVQQSNDLSVYNMSVANDMVLPTLADVSPEFKKVEDYYLTSINIELAQLKVNDDNKSIVDSFMEHLSQLDEEYKTLQKELRQDGTNSQTLEALIQNLQMRLELLQQLKEKLENLHEYTNPTYKNLQA
ncbi:hypothetical protein [Aquimarina agarivorans]|uniref:hypothetical protein n=1 Tax=Aquimarina agarivorans TaxID=980584 RepID=UPI000248E8DF|nr:hypothetical protein [Aquimarina agarivorans]